MSPRAYYFTLPLSIPLFLRHTQTNTSDLGTGREFTARSPSAQNFPQHTYTPRRDTHTHTSMVPFVLTEPDGRHFQPTRHKKQHFLTVVNRLDHKIEHEITRQETLDILVPKLKKKNCHETP